jgi:hypothetical protein
MTLVLASAADERYGDWLLNLVGSVHANANVFDRLELYDLGLSAAQRRRLAAARRVALRTVPPFVPHWRQGRTWKLWIWRHADAQHVLWLDAGVSVLRGLDDALEQLRTRGYFAVSTGHPNRESIPSAWYAAYGIGDGVANADAISTGIFGFATSGPIFDGVVVPSFEDAAAGRCLGFSAADAPRFNLGLDRLEDPAIHDCPAFRWDQSVVNVHFARTFPDAHVNDLYRYGGWLSPRQHPRQVFWNHRRRGDFAYLPRVRYRPSYAVQGRAWGVRHRLRWWALNHSWLLRPQTYVRKAIRVAAAPFGR